MIPIAERPELGRDNGGSPKGKAPTGAAERFDEALRDALGGKKGASSNEPSTAQQQRGAEPGANAATLQGLATKSKAFEPLPQDGATPAPQLVGRRMGSEGMPHPARQVGVAQAAEMRAALRTSSNASGDDVRPAQSKAPAAEVMTSLAQALGKGATQVETTTGAAEGEAAIERAASVDDARSQHTLDAGPNPARLPPQAGELQTSGQRSSVATWGPAQSASEGSQNARRSSIGETPAVLEKVRQTDRPSGHRDGEPLAGARVKSAGLASVVQALNAIAEHGNTPFAELSIRAALANAAPGGASLVPEVLRRETHLAPVRLAGPPLDPSLLSLGTTEPAPVAPTSSPAEQLKSALFVELRSPSTAAGPLKLAAPSPSLLGQGPVRVLELALKPASLGTIAVTLQLTPQGLRLSLQASSRDALAALEGDLEGLAGLFADAGYAVQDVLVELAPPSKPAALATMGQAAASREGQPEASAAAVSQPSDPRTKRPFTV